MIQKPNGDEQPRSDDEFDQLRREIRQERRRRIAAARQAAGEVCLVRIEAELALKYATETLKLSLRRG